jgi:hypothetical protein
MAEEKVKSKLPFLVRVAVYLLTFLTPPVLVGIVGMNAAETGRYEGPPTAAKVGKAPEPPRHDPDKPTAVVVLGNGGSEVTDVLAPYEVLSESGPSMSTRRRLSGRPCRLAGASTSCPSSHSPSSTGGLGGWTQT